ncbi:MAG: molybdopterin cofactor-binding domain-containing protein [Woeseiaceae bacterium]
MGKLKTFSRRAFVVGSLSVAGGVVFGYWKYRQPYGNPLSDDLKAGEAALTPFVKIDQSGITIITPRAEMGQGVHTTLAALVAEELDVTLDAVSIEHGPASKAYYNAAILEEAVPYVPTDLSAGAERARAVTRVPAKFLGMQITGGSSSTPDAYVKMRTAGAAARQVLLAAAAKTMNVDVASLKTQNGTVVSPDGQTLTYMALAEAAASIEPPAEPALKPASEWKLLGRSLPRVDLVAKSTGTAEFGVDVRLPGMLFATVKRNPALGALMNSFDASTAETMRGVKKIIPLDDGVVVVADNTWRAFKAANAITFDWADANYPVTTSAVFEKISASMTADYQDSQLRNDGDVENALVEADVLEAEYRAPMLAHATMEPMNATALLKNGRLDIWAGNQLPTQARKEGVAKTGLAEDDVHIHTPYLGGGFGRRAEMDFIRIAIDAAKAMEGTPVKVTWSREEDMTHDFYRPAAVARFRGAVADGSLSALDLQLSSPSVLQSQMGRIGVPAMGSDSTIVQAAWDQPYQIPHFRVTGYKPPEMVPVSSWRSVGASQNGFFLESIVDELAHAASKDPLDARLEVISDEPSRQVLETVANLSGWGRPLPAGHGLGIAFVLSFGVPSAQVIEVQDTGAGLKIVHVWAAVDVGTVLDPRNVEAQVQSGINFGLAAAMTGEITIKDGHVEQTNFHNYDSLRIHQAPPIEVKILEAQAKIRGIGEPGLPPAAPALANAIFAATGQRIRELPFNKHVKFA